MAWNYNPESIVANLQLAMQKGKSAVKTAGELTDMVRDVAQRGSPAVAGGRQWGGATAETPAPTVVTTTTIVEEKPKETSNWYGNMVPDNPLLSGNIWGETKPETPSGFDIQGNPLSPQTSGWGAIGTAAYNFATGGLGGDASGDKPAYDPVSGGIGGSSFGNSGKRTDMFGNEIISHGGREFVEVMGQTYELALDGSRIAVDMNYQRIANTAGNTAGVTMADLYGSPTNTASDPASALYGSANGLYGYSPPAAEATVHTPPAATDTSWFWQNTSNNDFNPYTGGLGQPASSNAASNWWGGGGQESSNHTSHASVWGNHGGFWGSSNDTKDQPNHWAALYGTTNT